MSFYTELKFFPAYNAENIHKSAHRSSNCQKERMIQLPLHE
jgi:hypothetical protein